MAVHMNAWGILMAFMDPQMEMDPKIDPLKLNWTHIEKVPSSSVPLVPPYQYRYRYQAGIHTNTDTRLIIHTDTDTDIAQTFILLLIPSIFTSYMPGTGTIPILDLIIPILIPGSPNGPN